MYGLKQAPLKWNERFTNFLKQEGLKPIKSDQCIFIKQKSSLVLAIYVDDAIIIGNDNNEMETLVRKLNNEFEMSVNRNPKTFLGMTIQKTNKGIRLAQTEYATKIVEKFGMKDSKEVNTPAVKTVNDQNNTTNTSYPYREAIGSLLYLSNKTRPDLSFAVNLASRRVECPTENDVIAIKRIFRYLKGTLDKGIKFKAESSDMHIQAYSDSDYAEDPDTRKSTTGFLIYYKGGPISWSSKKQSTIALSSTEAEYIAASECCKELMHIKSLLQEIITNRTPTITLKVDNQSTISLIKNGIVNKRSKHIDVRYRFVHELIKDKLINIEYCPSKKQIADILTKALNHVKFKQLRDNIVN